MTRATLEPCIVDFEPLDEHQGKPVFIGADLSQVKDITALGYCVQSGVVEEGEHKGKPIYDAWVQAWTPRDTMAARALADKLPYQEWVRAGHLNAPKGRSINYRHIAQALAEAQHDFDVQCLAYDRYAFSRMLEPEMQELGLSIECVEHPQGGTKKGKPTEGMKAAAKAADREPEGLWMPMSVRHVEQLILEGRLRIQKNPVTISAMMSAVTDEDRWGNYWLAKERATNKIDAAIALCMAVGAARAFEGAKPSYEMLIV
jgi:phage terminase large subunit-like protein